MKQKLLKSYGLRVLLLAFSLLMGGALFNNAWGEETTTYIFTDKDWAATSSGSAANWTKGKGGNAMTSGRGIQVTTGASGANATSPVSFTNVSKIVVTYSTNASSGAGSISAQIGANTASTKDVTKTGGTTDRTLTYNFSPTQSGNVKITVTCSTNSIYVKSVAITTNVSVSGVSLNKSSTTLETGDTETLIATVTPNNADNKNVSWESDDEDVATVSNGVVTGIAAGSANITVTTEDGSYTSTCAVTVNAATKTAVNITNFSATTSTLIKGNTTETDVTNDQVGWTAAYTYSSDDTDVATVNSSGVITAVGKGTCTITCALNVNPSDATYKAGTTSSKTIDITVNNPSHTVTFSNRGSNFISPASVEEGESITFPGSKPDDYNGYTFVGWAASTISGTTEVAPSFVTSATMSTSDITFYAVFAEANVTYDEYVEEKTQTLQYDTWTYSGSTTDKTSYRLFHSGSYIESSAFDLSLLKSVKVYGGTFGGADYNSLTIGDGTNTWKAVTVSGKSETGENTFTSGTALSGTKALRVTCNSGTATETGVRISKVEIYTKKRTVTYAHYCTTVSALPIPVITMEDVEMTWGETGKAVAPSAIVDEEAYDGTFTFEVDDDGLTVSSTGALSCNTPGSYTVTASIAATAEHQSASKTCTVTVNKKDLTLSFANDLVRKKTADASYTQTATASPAAYDGTISYSKESSSTSEGATVNSTTAEVAFSATGSVIVKATAPATDLYNETTATYTIYVQTDPTIVVSNQTIAQGSTYTLDTSGFASGDVTVTSANGSIGSVSEYVITGAAVGSTTITVSTAETDAYVAGEETFTLTVTAPTAATSSSEAKNIVFYESFDKCVGTGGNDGSWSGSIASSDVTTDHTGWTNSNSGGANKCIKLGTSSKLGSAQTPSLSMESAVTYTLSFKAAAWDAASESTNLKLSATSATLNKSSVTLTKGAWTTFTATVTVASNTTDAKIKFEGNGSSNSRFFLDEVNIYSPITSTSVTTTGGIATYCYQYPLDLDGLSGAKAYKVSDIDVKNEKVVITQITGEIKGGVPFILKSNDGSDDTFDIPLADASTTEPASNLLVGTLAPTFVAQTSGDYTNFAYSKSQECFVKLGASGNTVPANRAYLPIDLGGSSVKAFVLSFEDADGITETIDIQGSKNETIYNLAGQKLHKLQHGINIVNGKKVIVNK